MSWIVVETHSLAEEATAQRIQHRRIESFCPTYEREIRHARYMSRKRFPLYSRYIFANVDLGNRQWAQVLRTRGVIRVLGANPEKPSVVCDKIIALIGYVQLRDVLTPGERVLLRQWNVEGLFSEFIGDRCRVLISFMGKQTTIDVSRLDIERLAA